MDIAQPLMWTNLIRRYGSSIFPTILGGGVRRFDWLEQKRKLRLLETRSGNGDRKLICERREWNRHWRG